MVWVQAFTLIGSLSIVFAQEPTTVKPPGASFLLPNRGGGGGDCFKDFPQLKERFTWEQLEFFCQQKRRYDEIIFNQTTLSPFTNNQLVFLNSLRLEQNPKLPPVVRKDIRRLSAVEVDKFRAVMKRLKEWIIDGLSAYDLLVILHHPSMAPGSYVGAAFLPWHREYLRMFETAMRNIDPQAALHYWDSTMDQGLPNPEDSVVWSDTFLGNNQGLITSGPFQNWKFASDKSVSPISLFRNASRNGTLPSPALIQFITSQTSYKDLTACVDLTVEQANRQVHEWVGGVMKEMYYSPQDPVFFLHHAFFDYMWEKFRQKQTAQNRVGEYPPNYEACTTFHYANSEMRPFAPLTNKDGLSEVYTQKYYTYEDRPACQGSNGCGSEYLFCDTERNRCVSKLRPGASCEGINASFSPCFQGNCVNGRCAAAAARSAPKGTNGKTAKNAAPNANNQKPSSTGKQQSAVRNTLG